MRLLKADVAALTVPQEDSSGYRGESFGKKAARLSFWEKALSVLQEKDLPIRALVLASREGGDISTLLGLGVPRESIVAVDIDRFAVQSCLEKWGPPVLHMSLEEAIERHKDEPFTVIHADFCNVVSAKLVNSLARVITRGVRCDTLIGVVIKRGREKSRGTVQYAHKIARREKRRTKLDTSPQPFQFVDNLKFWAGHTEQKHRDQYSGVYRELGLAIELANAGLPLDLHVGIDYQSRGEKSNGSPMSCYLWSLSAGNPRMWEAEVFADTDKGFMRAWFARRYPLDDCIVDYRRLTPKGFKELVVQYSSFTPDAHLLFNISKGTLAAWKAHDTRNRTRTFFGIPWRFEHSFPNSFDLLISGKLSCCCGELDSEGMFHLIHMGDFVDGFAQPATILTLSPDASAEEFLPAALASLRAREEVLLAQMQSADPDSAEGFECDVLDIKKLVSFLESRTHEL